MPYLDSKIDKHYKNCFNPVGKRLYIRDYDDSGKQKFVSWGLTCTTCGVVVKENYERNLTKEERHSLEVNRNLGPIMSKAFGGKEETDKEYLERQRAYKIRDKLQRMQRKKMGGGPMDSREIGLRKRIRGLKTFYEHAKYSAPYKSEKEREKEQQSILNLYNVELVEQFLHISPRPAMYELRQVFNGFDYDKHKPQFVIEYDSQKRYTAHNGYFPDPDEPGWLKYDKKKYVELLKSEGLKRNEMMREIIKSRQDND